MSIFDDFFKLEEAVHAYFGYKEDWVKIPLADNREDEWLLMENSRGFGHVNYGPKITVETLEEGKEIYQASIYTQRFLPKWVYRGKDFTMIAMDTHSDGNKYLGIFSNAKEVKVTPEMKKTKYFNDLFAEA